MDVAIRSLPAQPTACIRIHTTPDHIAKAFNAALPKVAARVAQVGGVIAGPPYSRYYAYGPDGIDMEVGVPVAAPISLDGEVEPAELPAVEAAVAIHEGSYDHLGATYDLVERWIADHGHEGTEGMWELYLTDPRAQPDPSTWRTQIVWPLKH
ncbi:MAG TPA: GyrI-like domain-containing protein [Candidatus Limnocylindria bacterium]